MISAIPKLAAGLPIRRKTLEQAGDAIADRASLGLAALLTGVILGRAGSKAEFGAYMLGMTLVFLAIALQESLISAPYTVNCRDKSIGHKRFLGGSFMHLLLLAALLSGAMAIAAALAAAFHFGSVATFITLALIMPCILVREFARRIDYAELKPRSAVLLSAGVAVLQLAMALVLWMAGWLNAVTCLGVVGLASLGGAITWYLGSRQRMEFDSHAAQGVCSQLADRPLDFRHADQRSRARADLPLDDRPAGRHGHGGVIRGLHGSGGARLAALDRDEQHYGAADRARGGEGRRRGRATLCAPGDDLDVAVHGRLRGIFVRGERQDCAVAVRARVHWSGAHARHPGHLAVVFGAERTVGAGPDGAAAARPGVLGAAGKLRADHRAFRLR